MVVILMTSFLMYVFILNIFGINSFFCVLFFDSFCFCWLSSNFLHPNRRRQFLSKAFVCCCFLVFCRIGENISQNVFCFIWWRRLKTVPAWMINILLLLISTILTDIDVVKLTRVPGSLRSKPDAVYACCPNCGRYSFTFTTATVTVVVTAWEGSVSRAVIWKQNRHSVTLLF